MSEYSNLYDAKLSHLLHSLAEDPKEPNLALTAFSYFSSKVVVPLNNSLKRASLTNVQEFLEDFEINGQVPIWFLPLEDFKVFSVVFAAKTSTGLTSNEFRDILWGEQGLCSYWGDSLFFEGLVSRHEDIRVEGEEELESPDNEISYWGFVINPLLYMKQEEAEQCILAIENSSLRVVDDSSPEEQDENPVNPTLVVVAPKEEATPGKEEEVLTEESPEESPEEEPVEEKDSEEEENNSKTKGRKNRR